MSEIPDFRLYGDGDPTVEAKIQPRLELRGWDQLTKDEKGIALQDLVNKGWLSNYSKPILNTISYLNEKYLRECPGVRLHRIRPERNSHGIDNEYDRMEAALSDFCDLFQNADSEDLILRMLSVFARNNINRSYLGSAKKEADPEKREEYIKLAFEKFDRLANCLNHIFEQFAVNAVVTRSGFVPRQDPWIDQEVYRPTLEALSDPRWEDVNGDLGAMFSDYRAGEYSEVITKAHSVVHRFLKILLHEDGGSGKGEIGKLFNLARDENVISDNQFARSLVKAIQSHLSSERAIKSTAKPALEKATASDALLTMNVVIVFIQYCLQNVD